jgi:isoleucyl-tRNA synthetase
MDGGRFYQALACLAQFRQWASAEWFALSKRTLYCAPEGSADLASVQWALRESFLLCAQMLATMMPFACEEAYLAWPGHPRTSLFLHALPAQDERSAMDAALCDAESMLAWRRSLLPLVERARALVEKGTPVCLAFGGVPDPHGEARLRALFPGCLVLQGEHAHALAAWEAGPAGATVTVPVRAGKPARVPQRCERCRDYVSANDVGTNDVSANDVSANDVRGECDARGLCHQCVAELAELGQ